MGRMGPATWVDMILRRFALRIPRSCVRDPRCNTVGRPEGVKRGAWPGGGVLSICPFVQLNQTQDRLLCSPGSALASVSELRFGFQFQIWTKQCARLLCIL